MVEELEAREQAFKKARVDKQKEEVERWQETERIKEDGRRLREEREREMKQRELEQIRTAEEAKEDELDAPSLGTVSPTLNKRDIPLTIRTHRTDSLDTTVRLKYTVKSHPTLKTAESIAKLMSPFGQVDKDSIVLSLKSPKKNLDKPPKYGTALVPFKQIGDAFAAVCASGKRERGLDGIEIGWVGGKEPPILVWLKKMGKLGTPLPPSGPKKTSDDEEGNVGKSAGLSQTQPTTDSSPYTSFPSSFVCPISRQSD